MTEPVRPQIGRLLATLMVTIGVLAAILVWEAEHVGSIALSAIIAAGTVLVAILITRRVGKYRSDVRVLPAPAEDGRRAVAPRGSGEPGEGRVPRDAVA